jgi:hypothetical protein
LNQPEKSGTEPWWQGHVTTRGGRTRWAHLEFTRMDIELTIGKKEIEELMNVKGIGEKSFLKLKPLITVGESKPATQQ